MYLPQAMFATSRPVDTTQEGGDPDEDEQRGFEAARGHDQGQLEERGDAPDPSASPFASALLDDHLHQADRLGLLDHHPCSPPLRSSCG